MDVAIGSLLGAVTALLMLLLDRRISRRQRLTELYLDLQASAAQLSGNISLSLCLHPPVKHHLDLDIECRFETERKQLIALAQEGVLQTTGLLFSLRLRRVRRSWSLWRRTLITAGADRQKLASALMAPIERPASRRFINRLNLPTETEIASSDLQASIQNLSVAIMNRRGSEELLAEFARMPDGAASLRHLMLNLGNRISPERRTLFKSWIDEGRLNTVGSTSDSTPEQSGRREFGRD
jgi:hypothetical protein